MIDFVLLLIATLYFFNVGWFASAAITTTAFLWLVFMAYQDYKYQTDPDDDEQE